MHQKVLEYDSLGILPQEEETEEFFLKRGEQWTNCTPSNVPLIFSTHPTWVKIFRDSKHLSLWEKGCTLIYPSDGYPEIYLRPGLKEESEVLSHELVHAIRTPLNSRFFEELMAYQTSSKKWRAYLGPIFTTPFETVLFLLFATLPYLGFLEFYLNNSLSYLGYLFLPFVLYLFFLALRLTAMHKIFNRAKKTLHDGGFENGTALAILIRLKDIEILQLAFFPPTKVKDFFATSESLRFKIILAKFF